MFGGQGSSKRRCWYMHFKSSLVPQPQLNLVINIDNVIVLNYSLNDSKSRFSLHCKIARVRILPANLEMVLRLEMKRALMMETTDIEAASIFM